jgi:hypothetical protein
MNVKHKALINAVGALFTGEKFSEWTVYHSIRF